MRKTRRKRIRREKHWIHCRECMTMETNTYMASVQAQMTDRKLCYTCNFWWNRWKKCGDMRSIIVADRAYWIGNEDSSPSHTRGFGGAPYLIHLFNVTPNKLMKSTNLWANGDIPERFKIRIANNAHFLKPDDFKFKKEIDKYEVFEIRGGVERRVLYGHNEVEVKPHESVGEEGEHNDNSA